MKPLARSLAELLGRGETLRAFRLLAAMERARPTKAGVIGPSAVAPRHAPAPAALSVGPWERDATAGDGAFVRTRHPEEWWMWAAVRRIPPKGVRRRVVLIGESVARGFFYDPAINPASVLQTMLRAGLRSGDDVEVIDLAKIDLGLDALLELVESSIALGPDVLVIFAGNNWHPLTGRPPDLMRELARLVRDARAWREVARALERTLQTRAESCVARIAAIAGANRCLPVIVVPEFNLRDWTHTCVDLPLLDEARVEQWLTARAIAEDAMATGAWERAARAGAEMLALDEGTTPVGATILATVQHEYGAYDRARGLLEQARDAGIASFHHPEPRCYGVIQTVLRDAARTGCVVVDLPAACERHLGGELPDRRLFHDYCHLTFEGMRVAMAAAAGPILQHLAGTAPPLAAIMGAAPDPAARVRADAHVLAAIHNANWGQRPEIVRHHLRAAAALAPKALAMMRYVADFQVRGAPSVLCHAFEQMAQMQNLSAVNLLSRSPRLDKPIAFDLIQAIVDEIRLRDAKDADALARVIEAEHAPTQPRDLARTPYAASTVVMRVDDAPQGFYRARENPSRFTLIAGEPAPVDVRVIYRTSSRSPEDAMAVHVNGAWLCHGATTGTWRQLTFTIAADHLHRGINHIEIHWPTRGWARRVDAEQIAAALDVGGRPSVALVYGELFELRVLARAAVAAVEDDGARHAVAARAVTPAATAVRDLAEQA